MTVNTKTRKLIKTIAAAAACAAAVGALTACGNSAAAAVATADHPQTLNVAISSINIPYSYVGKDNKLAGFEAEVLRAVDKELPEYEFNYKTYDFNGVLTQLNAGKADLAISSLDATKERLNKFGATSSYVKAVVQLTVSAKNDSIKSVDDLKGGSYYGLAPAYPASQYIEKYNKEHNADIKIDYGNLSPEQLVTSVYEGKYDATALNPVTIKSTNDQYGDKLKAVGQELTSANIVAYSPNKKLAALPKIDAALEKLYKDGTLKKLSEQYLGADYSQYVPADDLLKSAN